MTGTIDTAAGASSISTLGSQMGEHTPAPWVFRVYANDEVDIANIRSVGLEPVRLLSNDGQATVMTGGDDPKPVARVECQTKFKRGQGYRTNCSERDANAYLIAAAPLLLNDAQTVLFHLRRGDHKDPRCVDQMIGALEAAIAKATGVAP